MPAESLTPEVLEELRLALVRERALGASQADETGAEADEATDLVDEEVELALESAARQKLAEVEAALQRIAAGTYGSCANCGKPISIDRLRALPWTTTCLDCANL